MMHNTASYRIALPTFFELSVFVATWKQMRREEQINPSSRPAREYRSWHRWPPGRPFQGRGAVAEWWSGINRTQQCRIVIYILFFTCRKGSVMPPTSCSCEKPITRFFSIRTSEGTSCKRHDDVRIALVRHTNATEMRKGVCILACHLHDQIDAGHQHCVGSLAQLQM